MRFRVERTSTFLSQDVAPCPEAVEGTVPRMDVRTYKSPEEYDAKHAERHGPWLSVGTEHEIRRGPRGGAMGIRRRMGDEPAWFLELDSLEALVAFHDRYGDIIIHHDCWRYEGPCIEIYDGYRE